MRQLDRVHRDLTSAVIRGGPGRRTRGSSGEAGNDRRDALGHEGLLIRIVIGNTGNGAAHGTRRHPGRRSLRHNRGLRIGRLLLRFRVVGCFGLGLLILEGLDAKLLRGLEDVGETAEGKPLVEGGHGDTAAGGLVPLVEELLLVVHADLEELVEARLDAVLDDLRPEGLPPLLLLGALGGGDRRINRCRPGFLLSRLLRW